MIDMHGPDMIAFEAPMMGGKGITMTDDVAYVLIGLAYLTDTIAASYRLRSEKKHVATIRKHFIGQGRAQNPKAAVMERCRILGWEVENHDAADAAAVWAWAKATFDKSFRYETATPMFARAGAA